MNQKALSVLEYDKIIRLLTERASSQPGKELCSQLSPMTELSSIEEAQANTEDALNRLIKKGSISFGSNRALGRSLASLEIGGSLSAGELLSIAGLLENANRVKTYGRRDREDTPEDSLDPLLDALSAVRTELGSAGSYSIPILFIPGVSFKAKSNNSLMGTSLQVPVAFRSG